MYIIYYTYQYISYPLYPQILVGYTHILLANIATSRQAPWGPPLWCDERGGAKQGKNQKNEVQHVEKACWMWKIHGNADKYQIYAEIEVLDTWAMFKFCNEHDWNPIWMIAQCIETWVEKLVLSNPKNIDTYFQDGSSMSCFAEFPKVSIFFGGRNRAPVCSFSRKAFVAKGEGLSCQYHWATQLWLVKDMLEKT